MRISSNQIFQQGINNISQQQQDLLNLQNQLSTGRSISNAADNPVAYVYIQSLTLNINNTKQYQTNGQSVTNALNDEYTNLTSVADSIQSLIILQAQGNDTTISQSGRQALVTQAQTILSGLVGFANSKTQDGSSYLYGGGNVSSQPFTQNSASGQYEFKGSSNQLKQTLSATTQIASNDTGDQVFMNIPAGEGSFSASPYITNTGTPSLSSSSIVNPATYIPGNYTMQFTSAGLGVNVSVINSNGTTVLAPTPYTSGMQVNFNGLQMNINGAPAAGDNISIQSGGNQSLFSTVQQMINNLKSNTPSTAINTQVLNQLNNAANNISNLITSIGSRLQQVTQLNAVNVDIINTSQQALTQLQSTDPAAVIIQYQQQTINLQAAQQSFIKIGNLSIFNYLGG